MTFPFPEAKDLQDGKISKLEGFVSVDRKIYLKSQITPEGEYKAKVIFIGPYFSMRAEYELIEATYEDLHWAMSFLIKAELSPPIKEDFLFDYLRRMKLASERVSPKMAVHNHPYIKAEVDWTRSYIDANPDKIDVTSFNAVMNYTTVNPVEEAARSDWRSFRSWLRTAYDICGSKT